MVTRIWTHYNVTQNGKIKFGGAVFTKAGIYTSLVHGCTIKTCKCIKGYWVTINFGYDKKRKSVTGMTFYFNKNRKAFYDFLDNDEYRL